MSENLSEPIVAYKGFDAKFQCRSFQFAVGEKNIHEGEVEKCKSGFHSCIRPLDVFNYYAPNESRFAVVEVGGKLSREENGDSKIASSELYVKAEIKIPMLVLAAINYVTAMCVKSDGNHATGDQSASSATGDRSASSATGYQSASSATGDQSASSATGDQSASSATGDQSASSATGDRSASSATGDQSASSATGYQSASSATGKNAVAMNIGVQGKAKADDGGAIVLCAHDGDGNMTHIKAARVGENGIKSDVWYRLNGDGEFVECD